jgi:hypothetical protein
MLLGVLHYMCGLSLINCRFVLRTLRKIVQLAYLSQGQMLFDDQQVLNSLPTDARKVFKRFDVESDTLSFVCCPKCFKCYSFDPGDPESYPVRCTNKPTISSDACNRTLRKARTIRGVEYSRPTRQFIYHDMKKWVGRLLSRPGMEDVLDRKYSPSLAPEDAPEGFCDDILGAPGLQNFMGPDKKTPFLVSPGNLVFSLAMDGFNPYRMMQAGKKVSVGAIYMVCLNLPPEIRYRFENMYLVGVIPGPSEPSLDQINYMLEPLVTDLLKFWDSGVHYSHTPNYPLGRRIHCAVIPLICDLPAARKMSGFASYSALHFCSICMQTLDQIDDTDPSKWKRRTCKQHRKWAKEWQQASSTAAREKLVEKNGVRYSQLLELPYWDPILFTLVDSMHAFFLGNLKRHCREIWGMDIMLADGDGAWVDPCPGSSSLPSESDIKRAWRHLRKSSAAMVSRELTVPILQHLCRETQTLPEARYMYKKKRLVAALIQYVSLSIIFHTSGLISSQRINRGWFDKDGKLIESDLDLPVESIADQVEEAKEALRTFSKSAFNRAYSKQVLARLWASIKACSFTEANKEKKQDLVDELIKWVRYSLSLRIIGLLTSYKESGRRVDRFGWQNIEPCIQAFATPDDEKDGSSRQGCHC